MSTNNAEKALRQRLAGLNLPDGAIDMIVKGEKTAGTLVDDGTEVTIRISDLSAALSEISAASQEVIESEGAPDEVIMKGSGVADILTRAEQFARSGFGNSEAIIEYLQGAIPSIQKGMLAVGRVVQDLAETVVGQNTEIEELRKGLGAPVPPRAKNGDLTPAAHPGDEPKKKAGEPTYNELHRTLRNAQTEFMAKGDTAEALKIGAAVTDLEAGFPPRVVIDKHEIKFNG